MWIIHTNNFVLIENKSIKLPYTIGKIIQQNNKSKKMEKELNLTHIQLTTTPIKTILEARGVKPISPPELLRQFSDKLGKRMTAWRFHKLLDGRIIPNVQEDALLRHYYGITTPACTITTAPQATADATISKLKKQGL